MMAGIFFDKGPGPLINWTIPIDIVIYYQDELIRRAFHNYPYITLANVSFIQIANEPHDVSKVFSSRLRQTEKNEPKESGWKSTFEPSKLNINLFRNEPIRHQTIVLFTGGMNQAQELAGKDLTSNIVLISEQDDNVFSSLRNHRKLLDTIAGQSRAAGVFVFSGFGERYIVEWLDNFFYRIAGNDNFLRSFETSVPTHISLIDPKANWGTPVTQGLENILLRINKTQFRGAIHSSTKNKLINRRLENIYQKINFVKNNFQQDRRGGDIGLLLNTLNSFHELSFDIESLKNDGNYKSEPPNFDKPEPKSRRDKGGRKNWGGNDGEVSEPAMGAPDGDSDTDSSDAVIDVDFNVTWDYIERVSEDAKDLVSDILEDEKNRVLQAAIFSTNENNAVIENYLLPESNYIAKVNIGPIEAGYLNAGVVFPDKEVFTDPSVVNEEIEIHFIADENPPSRQTLILPLTGKSSEHEFTFKTSKAADKFNCDIIAIHKNRVIQWIALQAKVTDNAAVEDLKILATPIMCSRSQLSDLANRTAFSGLLIVGDENDDGNIKVTLMDKSIGFYNNDGTKERLSLIKGKIQSAALDKTNYPNDISNPNMVELLRSLAKQGERIYTGFADNTDIAGPVQVISYNKEFVPANFIYNLPPPANDAPLCEHAVQALSEGKCQECYNKKETPGTHICPLGFWGLSKIIEYHDLDRIAGQQVHGEFVFQAEPSMGRDVLHILNNSIHGSSNRVDALTAGTRENLKKAISSCSTLHFASDWKEWVVLTAEHKPDSIFLVVHTERDPDLISNMEIEADMLPQNELSEKHVVKAKRPIAVVIGCSTSNIADQAFDIGNEFIRKGATIVISNFSKILSDDAAIIVTDLIELLKEQKGKTVLFGEVILQLKRRLLIKGIIVGMSLVTYGDADWKITLDKEPNFSETT